MDEHTAYYLANNIQKRYYVSNLQVRADGHGTYFISGHRLSSGYFECFTWQEVIRFFPY